MQYADLNGVRVEAEETGGRAICPCCKGDVIAKCGEIIGHHWAHKSGKDCDPWWEPEGEWHRKWKGLFPKDMQEVIIENHRADVADDTFVLELQHSHISPEEIREREACYSKGRSMVWLFDLQKYEILKWKNWEIKDGVLCKMRMQLCDRLCTCRGDTFLDLGEQNRIFKVQDRVEHWYGQNSYGKDLFEVTNKLSVVPILNNTFVNMLMEPANV